MCFICGKESVDGERGPLLNATSPTNLETIALKLEHTPVSPLGGLVVNLHYKILKSEVGDIGYPH